MKLPLNGFACYLKPCLYVTEIKKILTSTFFSSNSGLYAKHEFPNVSHDPLLPCNLVKSNLDTYRYFSPQSKSPCQHKTTYRSSSTHKAKLPPPPNAKASFKHK